MIRVAITGPESSGKTSLAEALSIFYKTPYIPEFARDYLNAKNGVYDYEDLSIIAQGQFDSFSKVKTNQSILLSDTELLVLKIWSEVKYGKVDSLIEQLLSQQQFDLYLLCRPDIPWEYDPLREHPESRKELFDVYHNELIKLKLPFIIIEGKEKEIRLNKAIEAIDSLLKERSGKM